MSKKIILLCTMCALIAMSCKRVSVDFTYSPAQPKAGQVVSFTNKSSAGEKWAWSFGDNSTSVSKNPNKVYKKPGEYLVTLMVDSAKYNTASHTITVYDTVPTFVASTESIFHCQDVTLTANIYNPFSYPLSYQWHISDNCVLTSGNLTNRSITVYFKSPVAKDSVQLTIQQGDKEHPVITHYYTIRETLAPAIVMHDQKDTWRQRIINDRLDTVRRSQQEEDILYLSATTDTVVNFNGKDFYASKMQDIFRTQQIKRLQIDAMAQKWYITTDEGLFVANFNGQYQALIDANAIGALYVDAPRNMLYWATPDGLKAMALIKSKNNLFSTTPILYNSISDIDRIVVNPNYR